MDENNYPYPEMEENGVSAPEQDGEYAAEPERKRRTRRPMTAEEKEAAERRRAEQKEKAANMIPEIYIQFEGREVSVGNLLEAARRSFRSEKKRTPITDLQLYIKPEENAAYYVINNEKFKGKVPFDA